MKEIAVEQAVGTVLAHDLTQIIPGEYKGAKFKKGHVIREEDIPVMLSTVSYTHLHLRLSAFCLVCAVDTSCFKGRFSFFGHMYITSLYFSIGYSLSYTI